MDAARTWSQRYMPEERERRGAIGCAMSARFLAAALLLSLLWYGWRWRSVPLSATGVTLRRLGFVSRGRCRENPRLFVFRSDLDAT
jgi:hypothetical protein